MQLERVYFDYNIYVNLAKGIIHLPENYSQHARIYVSVAHAEEFFNATDKDKSGKNREHLENLRNLFTRDLNNRGILNPSTTRIINKPENFSDALKRVREYDTRQSITEHAETIHATQQAITDYIFAQDKSSIGNSNLSREEIWERPEVIAELSKCRAEMDLRNHLSANALMKDYGLYNAHLITALSWLEPFDIRKNFFKCERPNFFQLEWLMEFLQSVLNRCGYNRDKDVKKVNSGIYDTEHSIYASYCDYFVTDDKRLRKRLNAIYYYLGLKTECLSFDEWCNRLKELNT